MYMVDDFVVNSTMQTTNQTNMSSNTTTKQLVPVKTNAHTDTKQLCCICYQWKGVFADINDRPYEAFYCKECLLKE